MMTTSRLPQQALPRFGLLLVLVGLVLASAQVALARQSEAPTVILASDQPSEATPSGEQTIQLAGPVDEPATLDPAFSRDLSSAFLIRQLYRGLVQFDRDLLPVPALAERIEISADGLDYRFTLRENAMFHDGAPVTAEDVQFSLTRALAPATADGDLSLLGGPTFLSDIAGANDVASGQSDALSGVEVLDERTVRIRLAAPRATFLMKLASAPASIVDDADAGRGGDWWRTPNGTGPFRVASWAPGDLLVLARFKDFFSGAPALERVEIRLGANALQPFNLYESGQIDVTGIDVTAVDRVLAPESGMSEQVTVTPLFAVDYIAFRTDVAPLDDPAIREALQLGFPRAKIASVTYDGFVAPASGLIPDGMMGETWPAEAAGYDLEGARRAILESSYGSAEKVPPISIYVSGYAGAEALRDVVRADLGLTIEVIDVDWPDFVLGLSRQEYPAYELYWGADYPDPESLLLILFGSGRADNYVAYNNTRFDELMERAAAERDVVARSALYRQAQQVLMDDHVVIPLYFDVAYTLRKPGVRGLNVTALGILGLETVWMER